MKKRRSLWMVLLVVMLVLGNARLAYAAEEDDSPDNDITSGNSTDASMLQISVAGEEVIAYIECGNKPTAVEAQIARYPCETVQVGEVGDISIHTIIMLDNSLSVTNENREKIKAILRQYTADLPEQEVVSFAVFGEEIQFLCERSQDTESIQSLIDGIEFHNQNTYLTDYLDQTLEDIENDPVYTRFIVISDGVDNKTIGITKEELHDRLKRNPRPVYTIGHIYKENAAELKNMFALSRMTGGKEFLVEDFEDFLSIADELHDFSNVYSCRMKIPPDIMDGANRHVLLKLHTQAGSVEVTGEAPMPFGLIEESEDEEVPAIEQASVQAIEPISLSEPEPEPVAESVSPEETGDAPEKAAENMQSVGEKGKILVPVLVIVFAAFFLYKQRDKQQGKTKNRQKEQKEPRQQKSFSKGAGEKKKPEIPVLPKESKIVPVQEADGDETVLLAGRYLLVLHDQKDPEKIFRYPLDHPVIVGRNIDRVQIAVDYSLTVSGQHCEFSMKNNHFFIRDMNSANHTYLNGIKINGEREVVSGNMVRLGDVEFAIEMIPL